MFAVSGSARPIVAISIASTLLYARAIGDRMSTSLAGLTSAQLRSRPPGAPARRHSRKNSVPNSSANATNAIANDRTKSLRMSVRVVLEEREVAFGQVVELEGAAAARALEGRRLEVGGEDRGGLDQPLLLVVAADAVERREERGHGAASDHVAHHRRLEDERHRAGVELVALDPRLAQELAPGAHAERVHVGDLGGVEHDAADHPGEQVVEPGGLGEVAAQDDADALAVLDDLPLGEPGEHGAGGVVEGVERAATHGTAARA